MKHEYTGRELHMLSTLREIYALLDQRYAHTIGGKVYLSLLDRAGAMAAPFAITGPTDAELSALIEADRKAHGWPVKGA